VRRSFPWLLATAFIAFIGLGLPDGLLGTGWPAMQAEYDRSLGDLGVLISLTIVAYGGAALVVGRIVRTVGTGGALIVSYVLITAGVGIVVASSSFWGLAMGLLVLSAGNGVLDPAINTYVARSHGPRTMNMLHASFGLGATLGPIVMVRALEGSGGWRAGYAPVFGFGVVMTAVMIATRSRWSGTRDGTVPQHAASVRRVFPALVGFALAGGTEVAVGQWAFSLLTEANAIGPTVAAGFVAGFWGAFTTGRVAGAVWGDRVRPERILRLSPWLVLAGLIWLIVVPGTGAAFALPVVGLGMALIFPTLVTVTARRFPADADAVLGMAFAAMSAGVGVGPFLLGRAADRWGPDALGIGLAVMSLALVAVVPLASAGEPTKGDVHA
jgi:fucose permease